MQIRNLEGRFDQFERVGLNDSVNNHEPFITKKILDNLEKRWTIIENVSI